MRVITVRIFDDQASEVETACDVWVAALSSARRQHAELPPLPGTYPGGWPYEALVDAAYWSASYPAHPAHRAARRWGRGLAYRAVGEGILRPGGHRETLTIPGLVDPVEVVADSAPLRAFPTDGLIQVMFSHRRGPGGDCTLDLLVSEAGWRQGWRVLQGTDPEDAEEEWRLAWERWQ